jgi:hypothetical protein
MDLQKKSRMQYRFMIQFSWDRAKRSISATFNAGQEDILFSLWVRTRKAVFIRL